MARSLCKKISGSDHWQRIAAGQGSIILPETLNIYQGGGKLQGKRRS
jgi:hypothetical protein